MLCWQYDGVDPPKNPSNGNIKKLVGLADYEDEIKELQRFLTACDYKVHVLEHPNHQDVDKILAGIKRDKGEKEEEVIFYYVGHGIDYGGDGNHTAMILPSARIREE